MKTALIAGTLLTATLIFAVPFASANTTPCFAPDFVNNLYTCYCVDTRATCDNNSYASVGAEVGNAHVCVDTQTSALFC